MPIRNPFARRPGGPVVNDENLRPESAADGSRTSLPGFERVDTVGSKASSAVSVRSGKSQDNGEYKMSVVNDSGVYLPPSPTERDSSWGRRYLSRNSTDTRSSTAGDIEPFSISRESFDSYRRSFDISAKSPVIVHDPVPRQSLDSRFPRFPRSSLQERRFDRDLPPTDEHFEEVGLNDDKHQQQQPKKRGFFSKFGGEHNNNSQEQNTTSSPSPGMSRFLMSAGRKRGQSGQGAELGQIERPKTATSTEAQEVQ